MNFRTVCLRGSASEIASQIRWDDTARIDAIWAGRMLSMVNAIVPALVWKRDHGGMTMEIHEVREAFRFRSIIALASYGDVPEPLRRPVAVYLSSLAGYRAEDGDNQDSHVVEQHGWLEMTLNERISGLLADEKPEAAQTVRKSVG